MSEQDRNNPLHGIGLEAMFSELLRHYHWEVLSAQLKFKCLENYPSFKATIKFLKKTKWAREKTEAFYLYRFKQLPLSSEEEHSLPPRERRFEDGLEERSAATINIGDKPFFDDPITGPRFVGRGSAGGRHATNKSSEQGTKSRGSAQKFNRTESVLKSGDQTQRQRSSSNRKASDSATPTDPWAKWKSSEKT